MNFRKIKFKLIRIFFLLILTSSFSQQEKVNVKLDNKNGFKDFKFGESAILHQSYLSKLKNSSVEYNLTHEGERGYKVYDYNNRNVNELFGFYWTDLRLLFLKDQLISIKVDWKYDEELLPDILDDILYKLQSVFGPAEINHNILWDEYLWSGQKVKMKLLGKLNAKALEIGYGKSTTFSLEITAPRLESKILYNFESEF
ncbi:MAG TPA: hypothetical protein DER05_02155 [Lutibacter sp.]|nr:hypothetical protein [Lutibacter sp.]